MAAKFVAVCAVASGAAALAEPSIGYYGYRSYGPVGVAAHPYGGSSYVSRSPQGLRGKRDADADADAEPGYYGYGYPAYGYRSYGYGPGIAAHYGGGSSYVARSPQGLRGKRDADADADAEPGYYGYGYGYPAYGYHGYGARSYEYRSPQGLGKRSADADADADAAFYGYAGYYSPRTYGYGPGVAAHYGGGSSYVARSPQGLGKRSADADAEPGYYGYGYGYPAYGYHGYGARSYEYRSPQGLRGKRSAEPFGYYSPSRSYQQVTRSNGYYADPSSYRVESNGYSAGVYQDNFNGFNRGKRSAEPFGYHGYGSGSYQNVNRYNYGNVNSYSVATNGYAGQVRENNAGYSGAYAYGFVNGK